MANDPQRKLEIVQAQPQDLDTILSILEEAARWLHDRGIVDQWPLRMPREPIAARIACGEVYLALLEGNPVGTLRLQWADPAVWGEVPDDAGYVHGLAIRRSAGGTGLRMLRWAGERVAAAGRQYLRLDCSAGNLALRGYYKQAGFTERDQIEAGGWACARFEKRVG